MRIAPPEVLTLEQAISHVRRAQRADEVVVMGHGCFDIVHPGHVRHLRHAAKLGDRLLVTVTADAVVGKGDGRPLIPEELRAENLAALDVVDWAVVSPFTTAVELLEAIRPDVYVKGREYEQNRDPRFEAEKQTVEAYGGRVVFTSGDVVFSSTALIRAIGDANPVAAALEQHGIDADSVSAVLGAARGRPILVIGETIRDTYVLCEPPEVAGESPVLTLRPRERRTIDGGAAIIARHLAALGARPTLLTAVPAGREGHALALRLELEGVELVPIEVDQPLVEKERYLVGQTKVMKVDLGQPLLLDDAQQRRMVDAATRAARTQEAVILADYGLGFFSAWSLTTLAVRLREQGPGLVLAGDVSGRHGNLLAMQGMDLLTPTEREVREALNDFETGLSALVWNLANRTDTAQVIVTLGEEGLIAFERLSDVPPKADGEWGSQLGAVHVPSLAPVVVDQLGCGDALLAAATLALTAGAPLALAAALGSLAAATQAQRFGNAVVTASDIRAVLTSNALATSLA